ncbi:unnamed protein product, partial [Ranitomeya imitator]
SNKSELKFTFYSNATQVSFLGTVLYKNNDGTLTTNIYTTPKERIPFIHKYHPIMPKIYNCIRRHRPFLTKAYPRIDAFSNPALMCTKRPHNITDHLNKVDVGSSLSLASTCAPALSLASTCAPALSIASTCAPALSLASTSDTNFFEFQKNWYFPMFKLCCLFPCYEIQ